MTAPRHGRFGLLRRTLGHESIRYALSSPHLVAHSPVMSDAICDMVGSLRFVMRPLL
ncbi:hypothetical protein [Nocardia altamirensis]|uniref:hypothetical protein n=1 Tax=Nocardia altamirensis TaxID=472158 RepID=UPI00143554C0|nr:hypothetical protein [Nocardia altamirensis]